MSIVAWRFVGQGSMASIRRKCVGCAGLINNFSVINPKSARLPEIPWCGTHGVGLSSCSARCRIRTKPRFMAETHGFIDHDRPPNITTF